MGLDRYLRTKRIDTALSAARLAKRASQSRLLQRVTLWGRERSLWIWPFGQACCGGESIRSIVERTDLHSSGVEIAASSNEADVLVVSGVVSLKSLREARRVHEEMPRPNWVLSLGHDGNVADNKGPAVYAEAGSVNEALPVDVRVPGCPPTPGSLIDGLKEIRKLIDSRG